MPYDTAPHELLLTPSSVNAESPTRPVRSGGAGAGAGTGSVRPPAAGTVTSQAPPAAQAAAVDSSRPVISPHARLTAEDQEEAGMLTSMFFCHIGLIGKAASQ